jgi:hypothetical protein
MGGKRDAWDERDRVDVAHLGALLILFSALRRASDSIDGGDIIFCSGGRVERAIN